MTGFGRRAAISLTLATYASLVQAQSREPYLPLAEATVIAFGEEVELLLEEVIEFASEENLKIQRGDFPKEGRRVVNVVLRFEADAMFVLNNFLTATEFNLIAYSHVDPKVWRETWQKLLDRLSSRLGKDHVSLRGQNPK
jgi:hypothetical protein